MFFSKPFFHHYDLPSVFGLLIVFLYCFAGSVFIVVGAVSSASLLIGKFSGVGSWAEVSSLLLIASTVPPALVAAFVAEFLLIKHDRLDRETVLSLLAASASWYWKVVSELALCIAAVALFVWLTTTAWLAWTEPGAMALWMEPSILEVLGYTIMDHNEISFLWGQVAVISVCYGTAIALLKSVLFGPRPPHSWTEAINRLRAEGTP